MPKFRDYFRQMTAENQELFGDFAAVHAKYALDKSANQEEFNRIGAVIQEVVREWEGRLCGYSERGDNAVFSKNLAEKFYGEVKAFFPLYDFIGIEVVKPGVKVDKVEQVEELKKVKEVAKVVDKDMAEIDAMDMNNVDDFVIKKLF